MKWTVLAVACVVTMLGFALNGQVRGNTSSDEALPLPRVVTGYDLTGNRFTVDPFMQVAHIQNVDGRRPLLVHIEIGEEGELTLRTRISARVGLMLVETRSNQSMGFEVWLVTKSGMRNLGEYEVGPSEIDEIEWIDPGSGPRGSIGTINKILGRLPGGLIGLGLRCILAADACMRDARGLYRICLQNADTIGEVNCCFDVVTVDLAHCATTCGTNGPDQSEFEACTN